MRTGLLKNKIILLKQVKTETEYSIGASTNEIKSLKSISSLHRNYNK